MVTVARERGGQNIWLANNGKVDASTETDRDTQVLLAHLPFAFRPDADRALVIGFASGITTGSIVLHDKPTTIDVVEIEPAVLEASREFEAVNHRPLEDPRVHVFLNDARHHLILARDGSYDLVSSEPSNPWITGVSNLFTREFFALGKRKLSPTGVWAQWVQTYDMHPDDLRSLLATFADVYPHVLVFRVDSADLVLVGSPGPLSLSASSFEALFHAEDGVTEDLNAAGFEREEDILSLYQFRRDTVVSLAGSVELNTDDNMRIEYSAPLHLYESTQLANECMLAPLAEVPFDAVEGKESLLALAKAYARHDPDGRRGVETLRSAEDSNPNDAEVQAWIEAFEKNAKTGRTRGHE